MSRNFKIVIGIIFSFFLCKKKNEYLIILSKDSYELYRIKTIANPRNHFYILLKYPTSSQDQKRDKINPVFK